MTASPAQWPPERQPAPQDPDGPSIELYRLAVEEYRHQADFNWTRTQYLLAFNVAVAGLGVVLSSATPIGAVAIFALGTIAAVLTVLVTRIQHDYYRAARDRMRRIEADMDLDDRWRTDTTASLGGRDRKVSVTQLVYVLLFAVALADIISIFVALLG